MDYENDALMAGPVDLSLRAWLATAEGAPYRGRVSDGGKTVRMPDHTLKVFRAAYNQWVRLQFQARQRSLRFVSKGEFKTLLARANFPVCDPRP